MRILRPLLGCLCFGLLLFLPAVGQAASGDRLAGQFVLDVASGGRAWYIAGDHHRYPFSTAAERQATVAAVGLGVTDAALGKIPAVGSAAPATALAEHLSGMLLLAVEQHGAVWYVEPRSLQRYPMRSDEEVRDVLQLFAVGVSTSVLRAVPKGTADVRAAATNGVYYKQRKVTTDRDTFTVDLLMIPRSRTNVRILTDTAQTKDCATNCTVVPLATYVRRRNGIAGMHGSYFCPKTYASCSTQTNFSFSPVYNSFRNVMINDVRIKFTTQPLIAFGTGNVPYYFHQASDFKSAAVFAATYDTTLQAAVSNGPALVEEGKNVLDPELLDTKQATVKTYRGVLGFSDAQIVLGVVRGATVIDSAAVAAKLKLLYAINLDGGGSTALYSNGAYILGPGRNIPNALVVAP